MNAYKPTQSPVIRAIPAERRRLDAFLFILNGVAEALKRDHARQERAKNRPLRPDKEIKKAAKDALARYSEIDDLKIELQDSRDPVESRRIMKEIEWRSEVNIEELGKRL